VGHYSRVATIVIDVPAEAEAETVAFWGAAAGAEFRRNRRFPEYHGAALPGSELAIMVQRLGEGSSRVHLDIHTDDVPAEVARLEALGATKIGEAHRWTIMRDPAGLPFCVLPDPPGTLDDSNATHWP
jgi:hypothetical protein